MDILFDINHPAHVHYFKHAIRKLQKNGHIVWVVARDKEITYQLLEEEGISFIGRGKGGVSVPEKVFYNIRAVKLLHRIISEKNIKLVISFMHPYAAQAAFLSGVPSLLFSDTEQAFWHHLFTTPFASEIHTPQVFSRNLGRKHTRFSSFMELAYLNTRDFGLSSAVLNNENNPTGKRKAFVRFVSRSSMHDLSHRGITNIQKITLVKALSEYFEVCISSEIPLPSELKKYQIRTSVKDIHHVLSASDVYVGESATMAAESAFLGVPAVFIDDEGRSYTDHLEHTFNIIKRVSESEQGIRESVEVAREMGIRSSDEKKEKRNSICSGYLNTTDYILSQIHKLLKSNL